MANNNERRVWATIQVAPDPFEPFHIYAVQELLGHYTDQIDELTGRPVFEHAPEPVLTRVLYAKMQKDGKMINVNQGSWEGRK